MIKRIPALGRNGRDMIDALNMAKRFALDGEPVDAKPYGCGHINDTYCVCCHREGKPQRRYILQRVNNNVFKNVPELMDNMIRVTAFLKDRVVEAGGDPDRECLQLVPDRSGAMFLQDEEGGFWRCFIFIENAVTFQTVEKPEHFYYSACAFGRFQRLLADFPAATLYEVIPHFHDTASRYRDFEQAVKQDVLGRAKEVQAEIAFVRDREADTRVLVDLLAAGRLPLRVTHNDTKLNNVMLDDVTGKPVAVIDLDTVMPGLSLYDFGDSIRFGASTAAEDEPDLSKVSCDLGLFEEYARGFLGECGDMLTREEIEYLAFGAKIMTLECGMRFLTDYLQGDTYFKIHRPGHNLDRCRTQFKLVADMEKKMDQMRAIVARYAG